MVQRTSQVMSSLYHSDETAWLERTAELLRTGRLSEIDQDSLAEYLTDMAKRDRREVFSRLVILLAHQLKWEYQPERRSGSWKATILELQSELRRLFESESLRNHALTILGDAYADARRFASAETELPRDTFPETCSWNLDTLLSDDDQASMT